MKTLAVSRKLAAALGAPKEQPLQEQKKSQEEKGLAETDALPHEKGRKVGWQHRNLLFSP